MIVSKEAYESFLPKSFRKLVDESSTKNNLENLKQARESLELSLKQVRDEIVKQAQSNIDQLKPEIREAENYLQRVEQFNEKLRNFKHNIDSQENLFKSASNLDDYKRTLERIEQIDLMVSILETIQLFETNLSELKLSIDQKNYVKSFDNLSQLNKIVNDYEFFSIAKKSCNNAMDNDDDDGNNAATAATNSVSDSVFKIRELREDFIVQRERLWFDLGEEWDKFIEISIETDDNAADSSASSLSSKSFIAIDKSINQEFLNHLTKFSTIKLNSAGKHHQQQQQQQQQKDLSNFIFNAKLKQFSKSFLRFCEFNIINISTDVEVQQNDDAENKKKILRFIFKTTEMETTKPPLKGKNNKSNLEETESIRLLRSKLKQIEAVFEFLYQNFFRFTVKTNNNQNVCIMRLFSDSLIDDFTKLIYEQLIVNVLPLKDFDFAIEAKLCSEVERFEKALEELNFLEKKKDSSSVFTKFVRNVEELYVRKRCKHVIETGRELMKNSKLIFDVTRIRSTSAAIEENAEELRAKCSNLYKDDPPIQFVVNELITLQESSKLDTKRRGFEIDSLNMFNQASCSISIVAKRVVELVYETFTEALILVNKAQDYRNACLLCLTAKNLIDLYACVVPTYHRENIKSLPVLSAICYNDFIYLAYNCLTITAQFRRVFDELREKKLNSSSKDNSEEGGDEKDKAKMIEDRLDLEELVDNFTCLDLVPNLRRMAHESIGNQVNAQKLTLLQLLNEDDGREGGGGSGIGGGLNNLSEGNNHEIFRRSVQKCITHLDLLASTWSNVLAEETYSDIMGYFYNMLCENVIKSCLALEDISSDDASYMHDILSLIEQGAHRLFAKTKQQQQNEALLAADESEDEAKARMINENLLDFEVGKHVSCWPRFKYLLILLKANLTEIVDLWSESSGPLAQCYDSEEIRHLIRALFMNTDRRSAALAKIK